MFIKPVFESKADQDHWIEMAKNYLDRSAFSWAAKDEERLVYLTAVYLYQVRSLCKQPVPAFPFFVVHNQDTGARFTTPSVREATGKFGAASRRNQRIGVFYWAGKNLCIRRWASDGYSFDRDFAGEDAIMQEQVRRQLEK